MQVQPGDIVGVALGISCAENFDNVLSLNTSGTGSSYKQDRAGLKFFFFAVIIHYY